jgi:sulfopyruvate decarboxylase TPP-binding subunit
MGARTGQARGIAAGQIASELKRLGLTYVITVPDTHQRTLLAYIANDPDFRLVTAATEDEAVSICAGLWWGGKTPLLLIQHAGVFASVNTLRGIGIDMGIPLPMLVGLYGRDPTVSPEDSKGSMNRLVGPILDALGIPHLLLEGPDDLGMIEEVQKLALASSRPAVALVGAETT